MKKLVLAAAAAAATLSFTTTAWAQEEEEPRTTWRIMTVDLKPGMGQQYEKVIMDTILPAYEAAGLEKPQVHWTMANDDWDYVFIDKMPGGMATFDSHNPPSRVAMFEALKTKLGSEEAVREMWQELDGMEEKTQVLFTHTHP